MIEPSDSEQEPRESLDLASMPSKERRKLFIAMPQMAMNEIKIKYTNIPAETETMIKCFPEAMEALLLAYPKIRMVSSHHNLQPTLAWAKVHMTDKEVTIHMKGYCPNAAMPFELVVTSKGAWSLNITSSPA
jgi:hypothetical protein